MSTRPRSVLLWSTLVAAAAVLVGCGGGQAVEVSGPPEPTFPPGQVPAATLSDLRTKLASIAQDECARDDPATIYPTCGRFVTEVRAALPAVREQAPAGTAAADAVDAGVGRFLGSGCAAAPNSGPTGDPRVCSPALATLQADLRTLVGAVGRD